MCKASELEELINKLDDEIRDLGQIIARRRPIINSLVKKSYDKSNKKMSPDDFINANYLNDVKYLGQGAADKINQGYIEDRKMSALMETERCNPEVGDL